MIYGVDNLTEDEISLILYVLNVLNNANKTNDVNNTNIEITPARLKSYKVQALAQKLTEVNGQLNEEGIAIYNSIMEKLQIKQT